MQRIVSRSRLSIERFDTTKTKFDRNSLVPVHPTDPLRFDLIIPGEQFFSLKAKNQSERQQWLLAIGSFQSKRNRSNDGNDQRNNSSKCRQRDSLSFFLSIEDFD